MKILITGGLGFIGTNFVNKLIANNFFNFLVVDNLINSYKFNDEIKDKIELIDITDLNALLQVSEDCTHIVHFAGLGSVPRSIKAPYDTFKTNVVGTQNVLECARIHKSNVIFASSSSVFGNLGNHIRSENSLKKPISPYGYSKYIDELLFTSYFETFGVKSVILRFFNVFGPFQTVKNEYAAVIPKMLEAIKNKTVFEIHGDGNQSRDFTYVGDVVTIIWEILHRDFQGLNDLNLAWGNQITLNELISILITDLNLEIKTLNTSSRLGDIKNSQNDGKKIRELFSSIEPTDLRVALKATADWYLAKKL